MLSTSDHETGGLAVAKQLTEHYPRYIWYPGVLANVSHSASYAAHEYHAHMSDHAEGSDTRDYLTTLTKSALGISDPDDAELDTLISAPGTAAYAFANMVSRRAQTGWSTHGHSGADVNIYSSDSVAARDLRGNRENTDVGVFIREFLGVVEEVQAVTRELREYLHDSRYDDGGEGWLGRIPDESERLDGQDHLDVYHGDHKHKHRKALCGVCGV